MTISITHGVNSLDLDVAGKNVAEIRSSVSQILGLSGDEKAEVNGEKVDDNFYVSDGDEVEFVKEAGTKGLF